MDIHVFYRLDDVKNVWMNLSSSLFTYPFSTYSYASLFTTHFPCEHKTTYIFITLDNKLIAPFEVIHNTAVLIGMKRVLNGQHLTDFGDIIHTSQISLNDVLPLIHRELRRQGVFQVQYDYVRQDSSLYSSLNGNGFSLIHQEVSPYVPISSTWNEYIHSLDRKKRAELKRKFKRLETTRYSFQIVTSTTKANFQTFVYLHKRSDTAKNTFMSYPMTLFFRDLSKLFIPHWTISFAFLTINSTPVSSVMFFESKEEILLYNSGYDPRFGKYSVGLLLKALLIKYAITSKKKKVDFLRGSERYKYDLGAQNHNLYTSLVKL